MASPKTAIRNYFPKLGHGDFDVTSPPDIRYNCIAWAAGRSDRYWWPAAGYYWPPGLPLDITLQNFLDAFATEGYVQCESPDVEPGIDKIAIYSQLGRPTHAARQLPDGTWTSKLGPQWDIAHKNLVGLEGVAYGKPAVILCREVPPLPVA